MDIVVDRPKPIPYVGTSTAIATRYWFAESAEPSGSSAAVIAGRLYSQPINKPGLAITRIGVNVTTGAAGSARLGIYANDNGVPGALLLDAGTVDTTSIAVVEATIAAFVLPEWCWIAAVFEATPGVFLGTAKAGVIGSAVATGAAGYRGIIATQAYGALPAAYPTPSLVATCPIMFVRQA